MSLDLKSKDLMNSILDKTRVIKGVEKALLLSMMKKLSLL